MALRVFRFLLRVYPKDFRELFGAEMCEVFTSRYRNQVSGHSSSVLRLLSGLWLLFMTAANSVREGVAERIQSSLRPPDGGPRNGRASRPNRGNILEWFRQDILQAVRIFRNQPGFTLVVCTTLALGIGANTALFSVLHGVILNPFPYPEPEQIVLLFEKELELGWERNAFPPANIRAYQEQNETFQSIGAFFSGSVTITGDGDPERLRATASTWELFSVLRAAPLMGRLLTPEDEVPGQDDVVVISHGYWQRRFGSDSQVLGNTIRIDGASHTIVGVLKEGFRPPTGASDLWTPLALPGGEWDERRNHFLQGIGRLKPGADISRGTEDLTRIAQQREQDFPETNKGSLVTVESLKEFTLGGLQHSIWVMMGAAFLVLLIACANVANLFLSRSLAQEREMAVRGALGASGRRLLHLLTTESLLIAFIGGGIGVLCAFLGLDWLLTLEPGNLPRVEAIGINGGVLVFSVAITLAASITFGATPAALAAKHDLASSLKEATTRSTQGAVARRLKSGLAVAQMTVAIVLLVGAGLLMRSFIHLQNVDPGFRTENVLQAQISLAGGGYEDMEARGRFQEDLLAGLERLPDLESAALVTNPPMSMAPQIWLYVEGREMGGEQPPVVSRVFASKGYFELLGMSLLEGQLFDEGDGGERQPVTVISRSAAEREWPGESPIGKVVRLGGQESEPLEVIGVVSDLRQYGLRTQPYPTAFIPLSQSQANDFTVMFSVAESPLGAVTHLRNTVRELDPGIPVYRIRTLESAIGADVAQQRFAMVLAAIFAGVALILAAVGIYGVLAYTVSQRTHEMGIRLALGAHKKEVVSLVLRQGIALSGFALALGLPLAFTLTRTMNAMLFEVEPTDPVTYLAIGLGVIVVALGACYMPATRAAAVSPAQAMREG